MRLLLDQKLSRNLIWERARADGFVIVSKDSDFRQLAFLYGAPPKVVWLRVGNVSTAAIREVVLEHAEDIEAFVATDDAALLVLPGVEN